MDSCQQFIATLYKEICVRRFQLYWKKVSNYTADMYSLQTKGATETAIQSMRKEFFRAQGILETLEQEYRHIVHEQSITQRLFDIILIIIMVVIIGVLFAFGMAVLEWCIRKCARVTRCFL